MRAGILAFGVAVALAVSAGAASATDITFDGLTAGDYGSLYTEQGYSFSNNAGDLFGGFYGSEALHSWGVGRPFNADQSGTSATLLSPFPLTTTTLTKVGGGAFRLDSIDFSDYLNFGSPVPFDITFNYAGGGSATQSLTLDSLVGLQTFSFSFPAVLSVSWQSTNGLQFDNVKVSETGTAPIPAAFPLFASALGGLGLVGWRRRRTGAA
jgi:hypothetical protein